MHLKRNPKSVFAATLVATLLAAGSSALVADPTSSPAGAARARITSLTGKLLDHSGNPLRVGSELGVGDVVKTVKGETARLVLAQAGTSSSVICIQPDSEVTFVKLAASNDADYPLLDAELALRNAQVRADVKRVF